MDKVIEPRYIIFADDIRTIRASTSPKIALDKLRDHFYPWWPNDELNEGELDRLRAVLFPEITSRQKDRGGGERDIILDEYQENIAKKVGRGHHIIRGIAGSGKSLVLCAKIRLLLQEHPDWRILLTCYNISLASQLKYYLKSFSGANQEAASDIQRQIDQRVDVVHFHGLCRKLFRVPPKTDWPFIDRQQVSKTASFAKLEEHEVEARLDEMESALLGQTLQQVLLTRAVDLYDAIVVDESQDFHPSWLRSLTLLLKGETNFLLLAEDPNQRIYPRSFSYEAAGIDVRGRKSYNLPIGYRSTREIVLTASKLVVKSLSEKPCLLEGDESTG